MTRLKRPLMTVLVSVAALALGVSAALSVRPMAVLASTAPGLGTAESYAILAGTPSITNTGDTDISGSIGIHPADSVTGFPPGIVRNGTIQAGTAAAEIAKRDLVTAYGVAASSPCNFNKANVNLGDLTLTPGTYCQTTAPTLTGTLTLKGNGVFIFQIGSTLVTAPNAKVMLTEGAQPCNVFWQVGSSATLDTTTTFVGTIMALTDIHLKSGAKIAGRALARNGTVTLITNQITRPTGCEDVTVPGPTGTPTPTPTATPTPAPTPTPTPTAAPTPTPTPTPSPARLPLTGGGPPADSHLAVLGLVTGLMFVSIGGLLLFRRRNS